MMNEKLAGMVKAIRLKHQIGKKRDDHTWIFSSTDNVKFNYNSKYLFLYVRKNLPQIRPRYVMNDPVWREKLQQEYGTEYFIDSVSNEGICEILKAGVWFTSAGLPVYGMNLNEGRRIINLWHGVPLKTIALNDPALSKTAHLYFKMIFSNNYTDVLTTSNALVPITSKSLGVAENQIRIWGQPRNDCLFEPFDRKSYFEKKFQILPEYKKIILYAPTFRTGQPVKLFPFPDFDLKKMEQFLKEQKILLLIRTHLEEKELQKEMQQEHIRFFNEDKADDVMEALQAFDLLITDYSSIYIDYMLLDRPIIFLPYDLAEYEKNHGFCFPYEEVTPGEKPQNFTGFLEAIEKEIEKDTYGNKRRAVNVQFNDCTYPCSQRICNEVIQKMEESV